MLTALRLAADNRSSPGVLAAELEVSSGAMTSRLDRLEARGVDPAARRQRGPARRRRRDDRGGPTAWDTAAGVQGRREAFFASALTKPEQQQLNDLLRKLMLAFEEREGAPTRSSLEMPAGAQAGVAGARAERMERLRLAPSLDAVRDVLAERRAVLEAVARPAADEPPAVALGVAADDEVRVGRQVVLADARADDRRAGETREPVGRVGARVVLALGVGEPLERVRVDLGAVGVRARP